MTNYFHFFSHHFFDLLYELLSISSIGHTIIFSTLLDTYLLFFYSFIDYINEVHLLSSFTLSLSLSLSLSMFHLYLQFYLHVNIHVNIHLNHYLYLFFSKRVWCRGSDEFKADGQMAFQRDNILYDTETQKKFPTTVTTKKQSFKKRTNTYTFQH